MMSFDNDGFILIKNVFTIDFVNSLKNKVKNIKPHHGFNKNIEFLIEIDNYDEYYQYCTDDLDDKCFHEINSIIFKHVTKYFTNAVPYGNGNVVVQNPGWSGILPHLDCPYRFKKYNYETKLIGLIAFIPLGNFSINNGSTGFVKGSHKYHFNNLKCINGHYTDFFKENFIQLEFNIGDLLIWHAKILHSGMPNFSNEPRSAIAINYVDQNILNDLQTLVNNENAEYLKKNES